MAYADQQMSGNKIAAIVLVALIHIGIGYLLISGLAYSAFQEVVETTTTFDIDEPEPEPEPEEEPPPPPEEVPETVPPPFVPPPVQQIPQQRQMQRSQEQIPTNTEVDRRPSTKRCADGRVVGADVACGPPTKTCPNGRTYPITAVCPRPEPEPEPEPRFTPKDPAPRGNPGSWASARDYPSRALREEREGVTRFRVNVGTNGRVTNCTVTGSSGHSDLDQETCKLVTRRARFNPATNGQGNEVAGTWSNAVRWQIPE
ncbi:MAG: energy transducer TonB [Pontixanthobacter sp.]